MGLRFAAMLLSGWAIAGSALAGEVSMDPAAAGSGTFRLDGSHSQIVFSISHLGLTEFYSRFNRLSGKLTFNPGQLAASEVNVSVQTGSVDTPSGELTRELAGPNVFDAQNFPEATFKSVGVMRTGDSTGTIVGDLTIKGVTQRVTLDVRFEGTETSPISGRQILGFHATTVIKRSDFHLTGMMWEPLVGDDVKLTIEALFQKEN